MIADTKPPLSPSLRRWERLGGSFEVRVDGEHVTWTFTSAEGFTVSYKDGFIDFPAEYWHLGSVIDQYRIIRGTKSRSRKSKRYSIKKTQLYRCARKDMFCITTL